MRATAVADYPHLTIVVADHGALTQAHSELTVDELLDNRSGLQRANLKLSRLSLAPGKLILVCFSDRPSLEGTMRC
jgi:hypothetical protein